jgi:DNA helicase HerA-like ATPase
MKDFEKMGAFYLGREYDIENKKRKANLLLYESKDLLTHAVCVGMTGSGKTGLCIGLLEEAVIDGIPAIIVDPKGDLANLFLTFPELRGDDLLPWISKQDAGKKGLSPKAYVEKRARLWEKGWLRGGRTGHVFSGCRNRLTLPFIPRAAARASPYQY